MFHWTAKINRVPLTQLSKELGVPYSISDSSRRKSLDTLQKAKLEKRLGYHAAAHALCCTNMQWRWGISRSTHQENQTLAPSFWWFRHSDNQHPAPVHSHHETQSYNELKEAIVWNPSPHLPLLPHALNTDALWFQARRGEWQRVPAFARLSSQC